MPEKQNSNHNTKIIKEDGNIIANSKDKANEFNQFFISIGEKMANEARDIQTDVKGGT